MTKRLAKTLVLLIIVISQCQAQDLPLWGLTSKGGVTNNGTIFSFNTHTDSITIHHSFGRRNDGSQPQGSLIQASNGLLYGLTSMGGFYDRGAIFSYNILTDSLIILYSFEIDSLGDYPAGSLLQANNTLLYGMTREGGLNNNGTLFCYDILTGVFTHLFDFKSFLTSDPYGSLIQAKNGLIYGMTTVAGDIFSYNILADTCTVIHYFGSGTDGYTPYGTLLQADDSLLYGLTSEGGAANGGIIFSYDIQNNTYTNLHNFGIGTDGIAPENGLIQATNGLLYGTTTQGGGNGSGIIFSYDISNDTLKVLYNFQLETSGVGSRGSLFEASNGLLYGMTTGYGVNKLGTIFSYDIYSDSETVLLSFDSVNGASPTGSLIEVYPPSSLPQITFNPSQLQISPNPSTGQFIIQLPGNQNHYTAEVYNMLGQEVEQLTLSNAQNTLNLGNQPAGVYFVYVQTENGTATGKAVVTK